MVQSIQGALPVLPLEQAGRAEKAEKTSGIDFAKSLTDALSNATAAEKSAAQASENFAAGDGSIHEVMIAQEKASISVRYALTLKNKAIDAYRELMNTPI